MREYVQVIERCSVEHCPVDGDCTFISCRVLKRSGSLGDEVWGMHWPAGATADAETGEAIDLGDVEEAALLRLNPDVPLVVWSAP